MDHFIKIVRVAYQKSLNKTKNIKQKYQPFPNLGRCRSSLTTATYICSRFPLARLPSGIDKATPAAGNVSLAPDPDTDRDCDVGELETSSAS